MRSGLLEMGLSRGYAPSGFWPAALKCQRAGRAGLQTLPRQWREHGPSSQGSRSREGLKDQGWEWPPAPIPPPRPPLPHSKRLSVEDWKMRSWPSGGRRQEGNAPGFLTASLTPWLRVAAALGLRPAPVSKWQFVPLPRPGVCPLLLPFRFSSSLLSFPSSPTLHPGELLLSKATTVCLSSWGLLLCSLKEF